MVGRSLVVALLAALGLLMPVALRAADSADCSCVVLDENNVPVPAAHITLQQVGGKADATQSDGAGRYTLRNLPYTARDKRPRKKRRPVRTAATRCEFYFVYSDFGPLT